MESTSPKKFRAKMKEFLDLAKKEKVRLERRSGHSYIIMCEEKYHELKNALSALQKQVLGKTVTPKATKKKVTKKVSKKTTKKAPEPK